MRAYYDTGTLVPLYVEESFSDAVNAFVESRNEVISFHLFHRLELENALKLKVFRNDTIDDRCRIGLDKIESHLREGKLVIRPVDWINAMEQARRIGAKVTSMAGCRTLDLLHVAIAVQWKSEVFVTADDRQIKAARAAGLMTVDVRKLPGDDRSGGAASATSTGMVRERRARYGAKRRHNRASEKSA